MRKTGRIKREVEDPKTVRKYKGHRVTCVHALVGEDIFAGCFSETHHIGVELNAIKIGVHNIEVYLKQIAEGRLDVDTFLREHLPRELKLIRSRIVEAEDALKVLKVQTNYKW